MTSTKPIGKKSFKAETKQSTGTIRIGLMVVGLVIAAIAYTFPNLSSILNGDSIVDQCKQSIQ